MLLEAFVLPLPGRSLAVVFWDRVRRRSQGAALAVYAPGELSPGELSDVGAALTTSIGAALGRARGTLPPAAVVAWWIVGGAIAALLALRALELGPAFSWLALLAVGATLPWGQTARAFAAARVSRAARRVAVQLGQLEAAPGGDPRARERLMAVWQFARGQRGSADEQLLGLEQFCVEQAWPAAAAVYADRRSAVNGADETTRPAGALRRFGRRRGPQRRLYAACEMRAWQSS